MSRKRIEAMEMKFSWHQQQPPQLICNFGMRENIYPPGEGALAKILAKSKDSRNLLQHAA